MLTNLSSRGKIHEPSLSCVEPPGDGTTSFAAQTRHSRGSTSTHTALEANFDDIESATVEVERHVRRLKMCKRTDHRLSALFMSAKPVCSAATIRVWNDVRKAIIITITLTGSRWMLRRRSGVAYKPPSSIFAAAEKSLLDLKEDAVWMDDRDGKMADGIRCY